MKARTKIITFFLILNIFFATTRCVNIAFAEDSPTLTPTSTPDNNQATQDLQNKINELQNKIKETQGQERTLSSQIAVMDNQVKLTQLRINAVQQQIVSITKDIQTATKKIENLEDALSRITKVLLNRIVVTYEVGSIQPFHVLLSSNNIDDFFSRLNYLKVAQEHDKKLIYATEQAKNDYVTQKNIFEDKKKKVLALKTQLETYTQQLTVQKQGRQRLLTETQGSEANYQKILAQTKAQLAAFSNFTTSQGGASILSNQTVCDDWGCYYNQRDSQWGGTALNNTQYTIASDGCLVTSMAMMYTHYGHRDVNPQSINSNSSNFGGFPPALLKYSISANGISSQRIAVEIDATLASGNPVVVGISYDGGSLPDHFIVLLSGSNGDYKMNDPFTPNGHNISFRDRYPTVRIVEMNKVIVG